MRRTFLSVHPERAGLVLLPLLVGCSPGPRPGIVSQPAASAVREASPAPDVAPDAGDPSAKLTDVDEPQGPVRFYTDSPSRERKLRFLPGEAIDAELSLDAPLSSLLGHPTFSLAIELHSKTGTGSVGRCQMTIDGSTKAGAQALLSRTLTVSIIPRPQDDALLAMQCEALIRQLMVAQTPAALEEIRGELLLSAVYPSASDAPTRTLASGRFRLDLAGGPIALAEGLAKLDEGHEQERRAAIPTNRMPRSKMPSLESAAMRVVQLEIADSSTTEFHPLRVVITDREWTVTRDPKSSVVLKRSISGSVAFRRPDKTCFIEELTFSEEFDGIRYQTMVVVLPRVPDGDDLLCENVWK